MKALVLSAMLALALVAAACAPPRASVPAEYVATYLPDTSEDGQPEVEITVPLPDTPDRAMVYKLKYPSIGAQDAVQLAEKFGITGNILDGEDLFTVVDSGTGNTIEVFKTGAICFELESSEYIETLFNDNAVLPSLEEAQRIAVECLEEKGLLPLEVKRFIKAGIGGGTNVRHDTHILVSFKYQIGDYQVEGPGFRYYVRVGDKGRVGEVFIFCPQVVPYAEVDLRTSAEASQDLAEGKASWMNLRGESAVIEKVSLRYYLFPVIDNQEYVLPVFVFEGSGKSADGSVAGRVGALATAVRSLPTQPVR
jgi:hypothetical protein